MFDNKMFDNFRRLRSTASVRILSASMVVAISAPGAGSATNQNWQVMVLNGDRQLQQKHLNAAEADYRKAVTLADAQSDNVRGRVECSSKLASLLALEDKTAEAAKLYEKTLHLMEQSHLTHEDPYLQTLFKIGSIYESLGDHSTAMNFYNRAIAQNERNYGSTSPNSSINFNHESQAIKAKSTPQKHPVALFTQPGLGASSALIEKMQSQPGKNLITKQENSNQDLLRDFHKDIQGFGMTQNPKDEAQKVSEKEPLGTMKKKSFHASMSTKHEERGS